MDVVLNKLDDWFLDAAWARLAPLRIPVDEAFAPAAFARETASTLAKSALAAPTGAGIVAGDWAGATGAAASQAWTTVSAIPRDNIWRQSISLLASVQIGVMLLYFSVATFSYYCLFDHRMMQHPRYLKGQVKMEIMCSLNAFPWLNIMMLPWFLAEVRGLTPLYDRVEDGPMGGGVWGWAYMAFSAIVFLVFTDFCIYWIHRLEHHPSIYRHLHKRHHKWVIPTPFSAYAFHPVDGYLQALPYHICAQFLLPMNKFLFLGLFGVVNLWTIAIHDSDMIVDHPLEKVINGPAHHTLHHMHFTCNYGQYFTWSDRWGGSYRHPAKGDDPLIEVLAAQKRRQARAAATTDAPSSSPPLASSEPDKLKVA